LQLTARLELQKRARPVWCRPIGGNRKKKRQTWVLDRDPAASCGFRATSHEEVLGAAGCAAGGGGGRGSVAAAAAAQRPPGDQRAINEREREREREQAHIERAPFGRYGHGELGPGLEQLLDRSRCALEGADEAAKRYLIPSSVVRCST
jgi:hypothetical protein